jgi:pseudouridylate synthase / pseudouridine kinase
MPFPENLEMARSVEALVRKEGAVPATVAVMGGRVRVGLGDGALEELARAGAAAHKCSRRDLARVAASGELGATTVSGTMVAAAAAGVSVFATGGIGGVHRGGEVTMDVSADLTELGRTPVAVVCAGVKSILDIGRTLEYLETQGVYVGTVSADPRASFPAFFSPSSGIASPHVVPDADAAARIVWHSVDGLRLQSGLLFAVPNPAPMPDDAAVERAVQEALRAADAQGVRGKDVTPFILARVNATTRGASLRSNLALVHHNVRTATSIANRLAHLRRTLPGTQNRSFSTTTSSSPSTSPSVCVVGASLLDTWCRPRAGLPLSAGASTPGVAEDRAGGVGRNLAWTATHVSGGTGRLAAPSFATTAAADAAGEALLAPLRAEGVRLSVRPAERTPRYVAVMDEKGSLVAAIADTEAVERVSDDAWADADTVDRIASSSALLLEANLAASSIERLALEAARSWTPLWVEPISPAKSVRAVSLATLAVAAVITPNRHELTAMAAAWRTLARQHAIPIPPTPTHDTPISPPDDADEEDGDHNGDEGNEQGAIAAMGGLDVAVLANAALDKSLLQHPNVQKRMQELGITAEDVTSFLAQAEQNAGTESAESTASTDSTDSTASNNTSSASTIPTTTPPTPPTSTSALDVVTEAVLCDVQCLLMGMCNPGAAELGVGLVEGRKHVLAKFGEAGLLWVSAAPCASAAEWREMGARPFLALGLAESAKGKAGVASSAASSASSSSLSPTSTSPSPLPSLDFRFVRAAPSPRVVDVSGAGDTLMATAAALVSAGVPMAESLLWATAAARLAVETSATSPAPSLLRAIGALAVGAPLDARAGPDDVRAVAEAARAVCAVNAGPDAQRVLAKLP